MRPVLLLSLLAGLCIPVAAAAQVNPDTTLPPPGTLVRVTEPDGLRHLGRFWYLRADTLWLLAPESPGALAVPLEGRERVEITRGRRRERWGAGGALLGGALGVLASLLDGDPAEGNGRSHETAEGVVGAAAGAVTGGLLGWLMAPLKWHAVKMPPLAPPPPPPPPATDAGG